jgi:uncharacterized protein
MDNGSVPTHNDEPLSESPRTTLHRKKERGSHDRRIVNTILDEGLLCHVGFSDAGTTVVVPTAYARVGDSLYLHGAVANHALGVLASGIEACVTVTLLDGLVLARSAFHHSMNYRSVMLFGSGVRVEEDGEKRTAVMAILDHMASGRSADARPPTPTELRATLVVRMPIHDGSAKVREGGPLDDPKDIALPIWAGHIPFSVEAGSAVADSDLAEGIDVPEYVARYPARSQRASAPSN